MENLNTYTSISGTNYNARILRDGDVVVLEGRDFGGTNLRRIVLPENYRIKYVQLTAYGRVNIEEGQDKKYYSPCLDDTMPKYTNIFTIIPRYADQNNAGNGYYSEQTMFRVVCEKV